MGGTGDRRQGWLGGPQSQDLVSEPDHVLLTSARRWELRCVVVMDNSKMRSWTENVGSNFFLIYSILSHLVLLRVLEK